MAREFLRLTQETAFNVFPTTPGVGSQLIVSLPQSNSFTMQPKVDPYMIRSAGFNNRRVMTGSFTADLPGNIMTYIRPNQAAYLFGLASNLTGGNCLDLASFTADNAWMLEDGSCSPEYRRFTGCKCNLSFQLTNTGQGSLMLATMAIMAAGATPLTGSGSISVTDFPTPAAGDYPDNTRPYSFFDCAGGLTIGGARTDFMSLGFDFGNILKSFRGETKYPSRISWRGRDPKLTVKCLYKTLADRINYEAVTPVTVSVTFTEGPNSVALNLHGVNVISNIEDDRPIDDFFVQTLTIENLIDTTAGTDLTVTVA